MQKSVPVGFMLVRTGRKRPSYSSLEDVDLVTWVSVLLQGIHGSALCSEAYEGRGLDGARLDRVLSRHARRKHMSM